MAYTSLFKKDDVRITQKFSSTHKGLDLSRGVVEQPIYFPNKAISGYVWKILSGYSSGGVYYSNAPIIYIKHKNGSGSRYIHSYPKNVKVKVGDNVIAGQQICATGNSGHSFGDHLHFEWLTKWDDLNTRVNPEPYVINDNSGMFKIGDKVIVTEVQNIRKGSGTSFEITGQTKIGDIYTIEGGPRITDGYTWWDLQNADWVADVGKFKLYTAPIPPVEPPDTPNCDELQKQIDTLNKEIEGLKMALTTSEGIIKERDSSIKLLKERESYLEGVNENLETENETLFSQNEKLESDKLVLAKEKGDLQFELSVCREKLLQGQETFISKITDWVGNLLRQIFGKQ